jgi:hypothetical protein
VPATTPDRVRVHLRVALEQAAPEDEEPDDHEVPQDRAERLDAEAVLRVEDPDEQPVQREQDDDREHELRHPDGEVVQAGGERVRGDRRHDDRGDEDPEDGDRAEADDDEPDEVPASRAASRRRPCSSSSVNTGTNAALSAASANRERTRFGIWKAIVNALIGPLACRSRRTRRPRAAARSRARAP